jgi:APA family basic amino acid/polyamine antiporter
MSCDGLFFRVASRVNKGGTPVLALALSTAVAVAFTVSKKFSQVIDMLAFFFVANYTLSFISLFRLRFKEPQMERPYRAWGYPWTTAVALISSILFLVGAVFADRENTPWALALLVASYPIFRVMKWASRPAQAAST